MRRIVLLAVSQCFGIIAFCQSPAISSQADQFAFGTAASIGSSLTMGRDQAARIVSSPVSKSSCDNLNSSRIQPPSASGTIQWFHIPCMDARVFELTSRNNLQLPLPDSQHPHTKSIPIPTQWPNARPEPIPTTWPNLKLLPVRPNNSGAIPEK